MIRVDPVELPAIHKGVDTRVEILAHDGEMPRVATPRVKPKPDVAHGTDCDERQCLEPDEGHLLMGDPVAGPDRAASTVIPNSP